MEFYYFRHKLKRPLAIFLLATICCLIVIFHLLNSESTTNFHLGKLTRREQPEFDHETHIKNTNDKQKSGTKQYLYYAVEPQHLSQNYEELVDQLKDLQLRVDDLNRIKQSVRNELLSMQKERTRLLKEKASLISKNEKVLAQISKHKTVLKQYELDVSANKKQTLEQSCNEDERLIPIVFNPLKSVDILHYSVNVSRSLRENETAIESTSSHIKYISPAFDYYNCPLTSQFRFSLIETEEQTVDQRAQMRKNVLAKILKADPRYTDDLKRACLVIIFDKSDLLNRRIEGRNLLVIESVDSSSNASVPYPMNAAIASSQFTRQSFRHRFDLILPSVWLDPDDFTSIVGRMPAHSPIKRKYLAAYFGPTQPEDEGISIKMKKILQAIHRSSVSDQFLFVYNCSSSMYSQCHEEKPRMLELTSFLIIAPPEGYYAHGTTSEETYLALSKGVIPVILVDNNLGLPFDEVIDWRRAVIMLPRARLPEIHFILKSYGAADLYELKYHGKRIFENYMATSKQILDTLITVFHTERFQYPLLPIQNAETRQYYQNDMLLDTNCTTKICMDSKADSVSSLISTEILGPRERPLKSSTYLRNFSTILNSHYELWNNPAHNPFRSFPSHPRDPIPPSEYKFLSQDNGYRPIGEGLGGSGSEFARAIGGDYPNEQFTVVLLTYEREVILLKTLERLKGMAFLNKIVVIWNSINHPPSHELVWPDVGVPVVVVRPNKNSLNNRFVPYDVIETDAIFTMDDDSPLRPDEIVFAFRVWRQSRDRIVGFPGRFHAWDMEQNSWVYNSNHSCELSMVLTGGAFFHRYYSYIYSYTMPEVVRSIVDKFMNCEDIAMNFLVAHMTRQPPIKVTSRWTFHCPSCVSSLSEEDSHFRERHECLNMFASIYGYMPLLNTQHRSDSILFKTRLPHDKQKCFKFV